MPDRWQLLLRIFSIEFANQKPEWWRDRRSFEPVLSALETAGLWPNFELFGIQGNPRSLEKLESRSSLLAKLAAGGAKPYFLQTKDEQHLYFGFTFRPGELNLVLRGDLAGFGQTKDEVLERFSHFAMTIQNSFAGKSTIGPDYEILLPHLPYPRPRPPHMSAYGSGDAIANFYSKAYMDRDDADRANWRVLSEAPLPLGASRSLSGDLLAVRWVRTLENEDSLARERSAAEIWQAENLHTRIEPGYNELGDLQVDSFGLRPRQPLTFYNSISKVGYKALVQNPDGSFDRETLEEASSWIKNQMLPDGTALSALRFVLPNRDSALRLHDEAESIGADAVLYMDSQNRLWNPFPPGMWITNES